MKKDEAETNGPWKCRSRHGNAEKASLGRVLGHGHCQDELWEVRGDESKKEIWRKLVAP